MDEMNSAEEFASLLDSEGPYGIQVVTPVAPADRESRKAFAGEKLQSQVGRDKPADRLAKMAAQALVSSFGNSQQAQQGKAVGRIRTFRRFAGGRAPAQHGDGR
ncbi:MAG: hypothetical protein JOY83_15430 [Alphaproteobacteria bacterium]|nr:hypothetical protein [Alphaproteobacteria bacterium]